MNSERAPTSDRGMTLIELVVTITVIGAIATVLAAAITVTFRQQGTTEGSIEVARWEQALALWLPTDLASADPAMITGADSTDDASSPAPSPCDIPVDCSFGSNALMLTWDDGSGPTTVSYRYGPSSDGNGFVLTRVECRSGSCTSRVVLRDLAPPTDPSWVPGDSVPTSVISVSAPSAGGSSTTITVSVNGIPGVDGADRSSSVSVTAGGVTRDTLDPPVFEGPNFIDARSGCGGPVTLIVDESGSIGDPVPVRRGVESFVRAFEGTPTLLQVITMNASADVLDVSGSTAWNRFFDLSEPSNVFELVGDSTLGSGGYLDQIGAAGGTDWEEAVHHAFYNAGGVPYAVAGNPAIPAPEMVVFFTDGLPTNDEHVAGNPIPSTFDFTSTGVTGQDNYSPRAWYRANVIAEAFRSDARLIGVGVGPAFARSIFVDRSGWPRMSYSIPNAVFLGDLVAGIGSPPAYNGSVQQFNTVDYDVDGSWDNVNETTHVLTTGNFGQLGGGLASIALAECGGTLTVQTREGSGDPADAAVTYTVGSEQATTTRINKAVTFDIPLAGSPSTIVQLVPEPLGGTGYVATGWSCRSGGADLTLGSDYSLITAAPADGVNVTVTANAAVACTMSVGPA